MTPDEIAATWTSVQAASEAWAAALVIQGDRPRQTEALTAVVRRMEQIRGRLPQNFLALPGLAPDVLALVMVSKSLSETVQDQLLLLGGGDGDGDDAA